MKSLIYNAAELHSSIIVNVVLFYIFHVSISRSGDYVTSDMFFSFDVGPVHFISISTEYLYDPTKDEKWAKLQGQGAMIQYQWLVKELEKATSGIQRR